MFYVCQLIGISLFCVCLLIFSLSVSLKADQTNQVCGMDSLDLACQLEGQVSSTTVYLEPINFPYAIISFWL